MSHIYESIQNVVGEVVEPALGEHAADYDVLAIAQEASEWVSDVDSDGVVHVNSSGFRVVEGDDFWEIVARHEK